jgi:protein TonB
VLVVLPGVFHDAGPERAGTLEVTLLPPQPLPIAPPEPESPPEALKFPPRLAAKPPPQPRPDVPAPALALPQPQMPSESAFTAPVSKPAEPAAAAPEPKTQVASVAPPAVNAAYLRNPAPRYPLAARRAGEQGTVTLRVLVSREGLPARVDVEKSSGSPHLDNAAHEAVKGWRFNPARRGTEVVEGWVLVPIVFRLEGPS